MSEKFIWFTKLSLVHRHRTVPNKVWTILSSEFDNLDASFLRNK